MSIEKDLEKLEKLYKELKEAVNDGTKFFTAVIAKEALSDALMVVESVQRNLTAFKKLEGTRE